MIASKLVKMANQIAANFEYGSDRDKVVASVVDHISRFWTPQMLTEIIEHAARSDAGLTETAAQAVAVIARQRSDAA